MSLSLASHLKKSRHGVFYFRMRVPFPLRESFGKKEVFYSLKTRSPAIARKLAYTCAFKTFELFEKMAYDPTRFNPDDVSTFPTAKDVKQYEIEINGVKIKADSAEDHVRALEAITAFQSIQAPAPAAPEPWKPVPPRHTMKLSKAIDAYLATIQTEKTKKACYRELNRFLEHCGDVEIHEIHGVDVVSWNVKLLKGDTDKKIKPQAPRTADNSIQFLQSLLKWGFEKHYIHHTTQLATEGQFNLTKKQRKKATQGAEEFRVEQLNKIFDPKTYSEFSGNSESRFWLPLIALFTGMRKEEIALLRDIDIKTEYGVDYFDINDKFREIKTECSIRRVPIHSTLLKLGIMKFIMRKKGMLFDETGNAVSHAFIRYLEAIEVKGADDKRQMVFHSFRDSFNNKMISAGAKPEHRLALMGHAQDNPNAVNYTADFPIVDLKASIEKLVYKGGDFGADDISWFNGGLFENVEVLPLDTPEIKMLHEASKLDWSGIPPCHLFNTDALKINTHFHTLKNLFAT